MIHRSWSVKGVHSDEVFNVCGLEFLEVTSHACGFKLENSFGFSTGESRVYLRVVKRDGLDIKSDVMVVPDTFEGVFDDAEVCQSEDIHLEKSVLFKVGTFVLGGYDAACHISVEGNDFGEFDIRDDNSRCVCAKVSEVAIKS